LRPAAFSIAVIALLAASSAALAASGLKAAMRAWKSDGAIATQMLNGKSAFDEAAMRRVLEGFISDSQGLQAKISGASASSKDVKSRFAAFEADANAALASLAKKDKLKTAFAAVMNDCRSCHDVYAN